MDNSVLELSHAMDGHVASTLTSAEALRLKSFGFTVLSTCYSPWSLLETLLSCCTLWAVWGRAA